MLHEDYLVRQVRAVVEGIARALGLVREQRHEEAEGDLNGALDELLRVDRQLFETLDAASLLPLLGEPERIAAIAQVLAAQAVLREAQGNPADAERLRRRARVFSEHARAAGVDGEDPTAG